MLIFAKVCTRSLNELTLSKSTINTLVIAENRGFQDLFCVIP